MQSLLSSRKGLDSLILQNHLYGCYLLTEDLIAQVVRYENGAIIGENVKLVLDTEFARIGIRYGFITDTQLELVGSEFAAYRTEWENIWHTLHTKEEIIAMETALNAVIRDTVIPEDAYFMNASGPHAQTWLWKAQDLLFSTPEPATKLTHAHTEKAITVSKPLSRTIRHHSTRPHMTRRKPASNLHRNAAVYQ